MSWFTSFNILLISLAAAAWGQTNPAPQNLPYQQDFSGWPWHSSLCPDGWQGWVLQGSPDSVFNALPPAGDAALEDSGDASMGGARAYNYHGKIGFLNAGKADISMALAINTMGVFSVDLSYDIMTVRNPYDGIANTRINEVELQYRTGDAGDFTGLPAAGYRNDTVNHVSADTNRQNPRTRTVSLPAECLNRPMVQLRWATRQAGGAGARPSFAIDNLSIAGPLPATFSYLHACPGRDGVTLFWRTESESGAYQWLVERSEAGGSGYRLLAELPAAGSSPGPSDYRWTDSAAKPGVSAYYRLGLKGLDGGLEYFGPAYVSRENAGAESAFLEAWPNPFNKSLAIAFRTFGGSQVISLKIYDLAGRLAACLYEGRAEEGIHLRHWDGTDVRGKALPAGTYICRLKTERGSHHRRVTLF